jgi:hypothetical protein
MRRCQPSLEISHSREIEQRLGQGLQLRQGQLADLRSLIRAQLTAETTKHQKDELHLAFLAVFLRPCHRLASKPCPKASTLPSRYPMPSLRWRG